MNEDNESEVTLTMPNLASRNALCRSHAICVWRERQRENCIVIIAMNNDRSNIKIIRDNFQAMKQQQQQSIAAYSITSNYSYSFRFIVRW